MSMTSSVLVQACSHSISPRSRSWPDKEHKHAAPTNHNLQHFPGQMFLKETFTCPTSTLFVRRHCVFFVLSQNTREEKTFHQKHPPPGYLRNPILSKVLMIVFSDRAVFSSLSTAQAFQNSFGRRLPLQQWA